MWRQKYIACQSHMHAHTQIHTHKKHTQTRTHTNTHEWVRVGPGSFAYLIFVIFFTQAWFPEKKFTPKSAQIKAKRISRHFCQIAKIMLYSAKYTFVCKTTQQNYTLSVKLHTECKNNTFCIDYINCITLQPVYKKTHFVWNYTLYNVYNKQYTRLCTV